MPAKYNLHVRINPQMIAQLYDLATTMEIHPSWEISQNLISSAGVWPGSFRRRDSSIRALPPRR